MKKKEQIEKVVLPEFSSMVELTAFVAQLTPEQKRLLTKEIYMATEKVVNHA